MELGIEGQLGAIERVALSLGRAANGPAFSKALQYRFLRNLSYSWMRPSMSRRTYADNVEWLVAPPSDRGVLFACNHLSFFDAYLYLFALYRCGAKWPRRLYFPVRSDFFYDSPLGVALNFAVGAGVMYPPIFRETSRRDLNNEALATVVRSLDAPCSVVGLHPEGRRNTGDPYQLLPAQPGIGRIVLQARPLVVPVFVNGLTNDFLASVRTSFRPESWREHPIVVVFGDPVDYSEFTSSPPRAALYKKCADKITDAIRVCGERERELRAGIAGGEIGEDDPQWLWHRGG